MSKSIFDENGVVKTRSEVGRKIKPNLKNERKAEEQSLEYSICGSCKKKKCNGSDACIRKQAEKGGK